MRHVSRVVERLRVDDRDLTLLDGSIVVVARDGGTTDWEVVVRTRDLEPVSRARHHIAVRVLDGITDDGTLTFRELSGPAVFVRAVDRALVFRGDGALSGFDPDELADDAT